MANAKEKIVGAFGTADLYEVLQVSRTASPQAIRRAYLKACLKHHPDKGGEEDKFSALTIAYGVLSDAERKSVYDECGDIDEDGPDSGSQAEMAAYYRSIYKRVTAADIDEYQKGYIGSAEEREDVIRAYNSCSGDARLMDHIPFCEDAEAEDRIHGLIVQLIEQGALEAKGDYADAGGDAASAAAKSRGKKRGRRQAARRRDAKLAARAAEQPRGATAAGGGGLGDLQALITARQAQRAGGGGAGLGAVIASLEARHGGGKPGKKSKSKRQRR